MDAKGIHVERPLLDRHHEAVLKEGDSDIEQVLTAVEGFSTAHTNLLPHRDSIIVRCPDGNLKCCFARATTEWITLSDQLDLLDIVNQGFNATTATQHC